MSAGHSESTTVHSVHFYGSDEALMQRLRTVAVSAINTGNSILAIAIEAHRLKLSSTIKEQGFDLAGLSRERRVMLCDSHDVLSRVMNGKFPDRQAFNRFVGELIVKAREAAWNAHRGITVLCETVSVLWEDGNREGALMMEGLWNDLLAKQSFQLHCAYPRSIFSSEEDLSRVKEICEHHSHVIGQAA